MVKYIPHLAEFYFQPDYDWSVKEAKQLYESEKNVDKIFYMDCIEGLKSIKENSVQLVIADPPFGINFSGKSSMYNRRKDLVIDNYHEISDNYGEFSLKWITQLSRILKSDGTAYIISGYSNLHYILNAINVSGLKLINHIIWKFQFPVFTTRKFGSSHYHILFLAKNKKYFFNRISHYNDDVWYIKRTYMNGKKKNGTKLPEELVQKMIDFSSKPNDLILDCFMGNGTTAIVSKKNYRHYIGFELNKNMKEVINSNLNEVKCGESYIPYSKRLPTIEILSKKEGYERAFREYCKRKKII